MPCPKLYVILICSFLCFACSPNPNQTINKQLKKAEFLAEQYPDSALFILNSIHSPKTLPKNSYYRYLLVQVQARDKSNQDISANTLIFKAKEYFIKHKDINRASLSAFYCGQVLRTQKDYNKAIQALLEAESYAQNTNNNLKGLIQGALGELNYQQFSKDEAINRYKQACKYFHLAKNYKNECITFQMIGNCYMVLGQQDSVFIYYNKGLVLADKYNLPKLQSGLRECIGVAYRETGNLYRAKNQFRDILNYPLDSLEQARIYYNLTDIFDKENKYDSALYYLKKSMNFLPGKKDNYLAANIHSIGTTIEEKHKNYRKALELQKLYGKNITSILNENKNQAILEIQKKYDFQCIQSKNKQLIIDRQRIFLMAVIICTVLIVLAFFFYRQGMYNKKKLLETKQRVYQLKELARSFSKKEKSFRNILLEHFGIMKKVALLEEYLRDDEKKQGQHLIKIFNKIVYGQERLDWDKLYQSMNNLNDGFFDRMKSRFPQLNETEFRICCLLYAQFSNNEIGILLGYSVNTIQMKRTSIRKKLGIESHGNIRAFLIQKIKNTSFI